MNLYSKASILFVVTCFCSIHALAQCTNSGVLSIGATGTYTSLTAAASALRVNGLSGPVILELQPSYSSAGETFPINFSGINCVDFFKTISIRPQIGATGLTISSAGLYTFDLNNTGHLIIDGRPGGVGTTIALSIINTNDKGAAVRFINNASNDTLKYLNIRGAASNEIINAVATEDSVGVIKFAASVTGSGSDSNHIYQCNIFDASTATPGTLIYAEGNAGRVNDRNTISNCNLYNFYQQTKNSFGVLMREYNSQWTISNNSFYQTTARSYVLATFTPDVFCIKLETASYGGFNISGNYFGGNQPNAGGASMNMAGNLVFTCMSLTSAYLPAFPSVVSNNVVNNMAVSPTNNIASVGAIVLGNGAGSFYGDCHHNTVGSTTTNNGIVFAPTGTSASFIGVSYTFGTSLNPVYVRNNTIGGITLSGPSTSFWGINAGGSPYLVVDSNTIGSTTVANSVLNNGGAYVNGVRIVNYTASGKLTISRNTISNLTSGSSSFNASVCGIFSEGTASGRYLIEKNTINNLTASSTGNSATVAVVNGISLNVGGIPAINVRYNNIDRLSSLSASAANYVYGIYYKSTGASGADSINANVISSFASSSTGNVNMKAIHIEAGNSMIYNNAIRLGIDANGNAVNGNYTITGISENAGANIILHNSVYIGGNNTTSTTANSFGLLSAVTSGVRTVANNIFYNARSTTSGAGKNYAVSIPGTTPAPAGLILDYNLYFAGGTNGFLGRFNGNDYAAIANWVAAIQLDNNSLYDNPNFINMTGGLAAINYHLSPVTPAENNGTTTNILTYDIDDELRATLTPVDIGADAGLYSNVVVDNIPPAISFIALPEASNLLNRTLTAVISDAGTGVDTAGLLKPRIWYRRKSPNTSAWVSNAGTFVSGNLNSGNYNFVIDYSLLSGTTAFADTIQYYVVAQDSALPANIGSQAQAQHSSVNVQVSAPANPNFYLIRPQLAGDILVGVGQAYTSLTNNGGIFKAINTWGLTGNVNIKITSDLLAETGVNHLLNPGLNNYNLQILPATAGLKTITNNVFTNEALIFFEMTTANITVDGSFNGSGKNLRFAYAANPASTAYSLAAFNIYINTANVTIKNCILESNGRSYKDATITMGGGSNNNIQIRDNIIRDLSSHPLSTGFPVSQIDISGGGKISITGNIISNASNYLLNALTGLDTLSVIGNQFYNTQPFQGSELLNFYGDHAVIVKNNFIGGTAPDCGGTPLIIGKVFKAIKVYRNPSTNEEMHVYIQNNYIRNFRMPLNTSSPNIGVEFHGIELVSVSKINIGDEAGNYIGDINTQNNILIDGQSAVGEIMGIRYRGCRSLTIANNKIGGFTVNGNFSARVKVAGIISPSESTVVGPEPTIVNIYNNTVKNITALHVGTGFDAVLFGIASGNLEAIGTVNIFKNTVSNLHTKSANGASNVTGIAVTQNLPPNKCIVDKNSVFGLQNETVKGTVNGIGVYSNSGVAKLYNNQISLINNSLTNPVKMNGIYVNTEDLFGTQQAFTIDYNSVYLGGNATSADSSSAMMVEQFPATTFARFAAFKNNLLYNKRISPSGRHTALVVNTADNNAGNQWAPAVSDYNLMVVNDTLNTACWQSNTGLRISQFKQLSGGDQNSYMALTSSVPQNTFFKNVDTANLNINNTNPVCWYVNGKGTAIDSIGYDFDNDSRSVSINTGATDIGADEFATTTQPPVLEIYARHTPGGSDTLVWAGRRVAIINWDNTGVLPALGNVRWFTGAWPNDTTNGGTISGARFMNSYLQIPVTGGSNYKYSLTLYYTKALMGLVTSPATMIINKKQINVSGSWKKVIPTQVDTVARTMLIKDQISFSEFTGTDLRAPLSNKTEEIPVSIPVFNGSFFRVYVSPNPARDLVTIRMNLPRKRNLSFALYDAAGKKVLVTESGYYSGYYTRTLNVKHLAGGMYTLVALLDESSFLVSKMLIQK